MTSQQMPNPIPLYEAAAKGFREILVTVRPEDLQKPTPCAEWNVQALVKHNVMITDFVQGVLRENIQVNPYDPAGVLPVEGAVAAFDAGVTRVLDLIRTPGQLEPTINTPFGPMQGAAFMFAPMIDLLIHRYDLSKSLGQKAALDSGLVNVALGVSSPEMMNLMRTMKVAGPVVQVGPQASSEDRLLAVWGRSP